MGAPRKETFEAQSEAVSRLLVRFRSEISDADQKHLSCAAINLSELGAVRRMILEAGHGNGEAEDISDRMSEAIVKLLHLPVPE